MCLYLLSGSLESALPGLVHIVGLTGGFDLSVQILRNDLEIRHYENRIPILCLRGYTGDLPTRECRTMTDCGRSWMLLCQGRALRPCSKTTSACRAPKPIIPALFFAARLKCRSGIAVFVRSSFRFTRTGFSAEGLEVFIKLCLFRFAFKRV